MKKILLLFSTFLFATAVSAATPERKLAFERNGAEIWISNIDGSAAKKIAAGVDPDISPDGTKVAFNTDEKPAHKSPVRHIAVVDVATEKVRVFYSIPSENSFGPRWSPDGKSLLIYIFIKGNWDLGLIKADGSGFRIVKAAQKAGETVNSAAWARDGKSFYAQDLTNLYQIAFDDSVIKQWPLEKVFTKGDMDSNMRFDVSPDGKTLLTDLNSGAQHDRADWDGPAPEVWTLNLTNDKTKRIAPLFSWEPHWLSATEILFISQGKKEKEPSIYRMSLDGKNRKLLVKNARTPSVSQ